MKLIIGLGNPGKKYEGTRHNVGWDAVISAAKTLGASAYVKKKDFKAEIAETTVDGEKVLFIHPLTFMNMSGDAAQAIKAFYKCADSDILIVHDEMDFSAGVIHFTKCAGSAGHNGVASIQDRLGSEAIPRLRIGISRPQPPITKEAYVLQSFSSQERPTMNDVFMKSGDAIRDWITQGIDKAMNAWNGV